MKVSTSLRTTEIGTFAKAVVESYAAEEALKGDERLSAYIARLSDAAERITIAVNRSTESAGLDEADALRDEKCRNFRTMLKGYAAFPTAQYAGWAQTLLAINDKYGARMTNRSNADESLLIDSMIADYKASDVQEAVAGLPGVQDALTAIEETEAAFKAANQRYIASLTDKALSGEKSATAIKKELIALLNDELLPYITASALVNADAYTAFATKVETELTRANAAVTTRAKRAAKKAAES